MATDTKIRDENLRKIDKYEYLLWDKILPSNERQIIEQAETVFSPLEKCFWETNQNDWISGRKKKSCYYLSNQKTSGFNQ